jgi:hypothetical protein
MDGSLGTEGKVSTTTYRWYHGTPIGVFSKLTSTLRRLFRLCRLAGLAATGLVRLFSLVRLF